MTAIRIVDDHLELASIGTNTHAQIDTHIAAADNYVKRDGSLALTADWDIGDTRKIKADEIRARDGDGLKLYDDGGNGIFVEDGGQVGIGTPTPTDALHLYSNTNASLRFKFHNQNQGGSCQVALAFNSGGYEWIPYVKYSSGNELSVWSSTLGGKVIELVSDGNVLIPSGKLGISCTPTAKLDVNSDIIRLRTAKTPATAGATGNQGDICWDANFVYVCVATNTWKRTAISTW